MKRYVTRPPEPRRALEDEPFPDDDWPIGPATITVHVDEDELQKTGLVDTTGTPLYRVREGRKIGFIS